MILVTGSVTARPETFEALLEACLAHVRRSRAEPGCISHDVHVDCENPMKLVFVERWADAAALKTHFAVDASVDFVRSARQLAADSTEMAVYAAETLRLDEL